MMLATSKHVFKIKTCRNFLKNHDLLSAVSTLFFSLITICFFVFMAFCSTLVQPIIWYFTVSLILLLFTCWLLLLFWPYQPFLVVSYVASVMALGESFDAYSRHCLEMPLFFPILYLCFGVLVVSYPCAKMVELHYLSFLLSMVIRPKRFVTTISVTDITSTAHIFTFTPYGTVRNLRSQVNSKFKITSDLFWLSCRGKPLHDFLPLNEISGTVIMHGRLIGGIQCCLKGCENEAGSRKFDTMIGQYEMKCTSEDITSDVEIVNNLRVCDKHYGSLPPREHEPAKEKSSSRSRSDIQRGILKSTLCIVTCSQCNNKVCLSSDVPCRKHNINIFNTQCSVGCNVLDGIIDNKTDLHNDLYTCIDPCDGSCIDYICMSCQRFFLKSVKDNARSPRPS